jgi:hypothetical protein
MRQENISLPKRCADSSVSKLKSYVAAMRGEFSLAVEFKDRPPVKLAELISIFEQKNYPDQEEK